MNIKKNLDTVDNRLRNKGFGDKLLSKFFCRFYVVLQLFLIVFLSWNVCFSKLFIFEILILVPFFMRWAGICFYVMAAEFQINVLLCFSLFGDSNFTELLCTYSFVWFVFFLLGMDYFWEYSALQRIFGLGIVAVIFSNSLLMMTLVYGQFFQRL